jgi:membrane protein required for colicin V production
MTVVDYLIVGIVLVSALAGLLRGFLREVCSLVTWILAVWIAWHFGTRVEPYLGGSLADPPFSTWAGRAIVFVIVLIAGTAIGAVVAYLVRLSLFNSMDRFLGFVLGALRGILVLGLLGTLSQSAHLDGERWWKHSKLVPYVESVAKGLRAFAGDRLVRESSLDL